MLRIRSENDELLDSHGPARLDEVTLNCELCGGENTYLRYNEEVTTSSSPNHCETCGTQLPVANFLLAESTVGRKARTKYHRGKDDQTDDKAVHNGNGRDIFRMSQLL